MDQQALHADDEDLRRGPGAVQAAEAAFGQIHILVNNAGIQFTANVEDFPDAKWEQIIAINLSSAFHGMRAAVRGLCDP